MGCGTSRSTTEVSEFSTKEASKIDKSNPNPEPATPYHDEAPPIVFVLGGPGSGKGTQCALIKQKLNFQHFSAGDLLREEVKSQSGTNTRFSVTDNTTERGKDIEDILKQGALVPAEITIELIKNAIDNNPGAKGYLIDGFPRKMDQGILFEKEIRKCAFVLYYDCPFEAMEARIANRVMESKGNVRSDDNPETLRKRLNIFQQETLPVVAYYETEGKLKRVLATGTIEDVHVHTMILFDALKKD